METRASYLVEVKMKAIETRLAGIPVKQVLVELNIRKQSQLKTWMKWYRNGELHRLEQPVGKQYTFKLQAENRYLKQQIEVLKKYAELEGKWSQKL